MINNKDYWKICRDKCRNMSFLMFHIDAKANELEEKGEDIIRLAIGRSEEPTPFNVTMKIIDVLRNNKSSQIVIPYGLPNLRDAISSYYNKQYDLKLSPDNVFINHGTSNIFIALFSLLVDPGEYVLLPMPYYPLYLYSAYFSKLKPIFYAIDPKTFQIKFDEVEKQIVKYNPKLIVINSLGNPLGNLLTKEEIIEFVNLSEKYGIYLWSDEAYGNVDFYGDFVSLLSLSPNIELNIITSGFSKGFQMYTRRIGYCIVGNTIKDYMKSYLENAILTVDPSVQFGAIEAIKSPDNPKKLSILYRNRAEYFFQKFVNLPETLTSLPKGGFYISIDCSKYIGTMSTLDFSYKILYDTGVAVTPGEDFGLDQYIRITLTSSRFEEAVDRLHSFFSNLRN